jgi:hypothetical protein
MVYFRLTTFLVAGSLLESPVGFSSDVTKIRITVRLGEEANNANSFHSRGSLVDPRQADRGMWRTAHHAEWLALLLDREAANRNTKRFQSRLRSAKLRHGTPAITNC